MDQLNKGILHWASISFGADDRSKRLSPNTKTNCESRRGRALEREGSVQTYIPTFCRWHCWHPRPRRLSDIPYLGSASSWMELLKESWLCESWFMMKHICALIKFWLVGRECVLNSPKDGAGLGGPGGPDLPLSPFSPSLPWSPCK